MSISGVCVVRSLQRFCGAAVLTFGTLILTLNAVRADVESPLFYNHIVAELGTRGIDIDEVSLTKAIQSENHYVRWLVTELVGLRPDQYPKSLLRGRLQDPAEDVRVSAAHSLASLGDESGREVLRQALQPTNSLEVRHLAAVALADLGDPIGYPILLEMITRSSPGTRISAVDGLHSFMAFEGQMTGQHLVSIGKVLDGILKSDESPTVRLAAILVLVTIDDEFVCPLLKKYSSDTDVRISLQAKNAYERKECSA